MKTVMSCVTTAWIVYIIVSFSSEVGKVYTAGQTSWVSAVSAIGVVLVSWVLGYVTALAWMDRL